MSVQQRLQKLSVAMVSYAADLTDKIAKLTQRLNRLGVKASRRHGDGWFAKTTDTAEEAAAILEKLNEYLRRQNYRRTTLSDGVIFHRHGYPTVQSTTTEFVGKYTIRIHVSAEPYF